MAHFARIDENNLVVDVVAISNDAIEELPFPESEPVGVAFCRALYGDSTAWKQTSYNGSFRKNFAGAGFSYRQDIDAFVPPRPIRYPSWVVSPTTALWEPPIPRPPDSVYRWDESTVSWVSVPKPYPSWYFDPSQDPPTWMPPKPFPPDRIPFGNKRYEWNEALQEWIYVPSAGEGGEEP
jgi:hypothetical protein